MLEWLEGKFQPVSGVGQAGIGFWIFRGAVYLESTFQKGAPAADHWNKIQIDGIGTRLFRSHGKSVVAFRASRLRMQVLVVL